MTFSDQSVIMGLAENLMQTIFQEVHTCILCLCVQMSLQSQGLSAEFPVLELFEGFWP